MTLGDFWDESLKSALLNHLWQSTLVVGAAWLLVLALRKHHARVRYWVWMAASVKFLLPFSLLTAVGEWMRALNSGASGAARLCKHGEADCAAVPAGAIIWRDGKQGHHASHQRAAGFAFCDLGMRSTDRDSPMGARLVAHPRSGPRGNAA